MNRQKFDVSRLRIAAPCSVGWETMTGDERTRHCRACRLNVYNIAAMTAAEVKDLINNREDRVCIRLYRRFDGTVLTKDCPTGLRAYRKKAARLAGAALAAMLGLFSVSFAQKEKQKTFDASEIEIVRTENQSQKIALKGIVTDSLGSLVPGVELKLYREKAKKPFKTVSDADGNYAFANLSAGSYRLEAKAQGFTTHVVTDLEVKTGEEISINIELQPANTNVTVGIYASEPLIDTRSTSATTKISREMIDKLPF